jgi:hypothetical protein
VLLPLLLYSLLKGTEQLLLEKIFAWPIVCAFFFGKREKRVLLME